MATSLTSFSRRNMLKLGVTAAFVTTTAIRGYAVAADEVHMRVGSDSPPEDKHTSALVKFKELIEEKTGGRIKVSIFPSAQLGDNVAMNNSVKAGTLDANFTDVGVLSSGAPKVDVVSLPFLFSSPNAALAALNSSLGEALKPDIHQAFHSEVLGWGTDGVRNIWNGRHPVNTLADVKGLKMRVQASQVHKDTFSALGALPTPIAFSELYTALQTKVVDGADLPVVDMTSLKMYQVTKYLTLTRHVPILDAFMVSAKFLAKLNAADADLVRQAGRAAADYQAQANAAAEEKAVEELKSEGIEIIDGIDRQPFIAAMKPVYDNAAKRFGDNGLIELARKS